MKIKLNIPIRDYLFLLDVITFLEKNVGPSIPHVRMTMRGFFIGRGWRIDHCVDHFVLVIDRRKSRNPWFTELLLRWA